MHPLIIIPFKSSPKGSTPPKRPQFRPVLSKRPSSFPYGSLLPLAASLRPGRKVPIFTLTPSAKPPEFSVAPPEPSRARALRRSTITRFVTAGALLAVAATGLLAGKAHFATRESSIDRKTGTPTLKPADNGDYVRWRSDAIDVVVDKSFSDLGGEDLFGSALDAWRASGAALPSVSTLPGGDRKVGYDPNGPNENVVVFAPNGASMAHGALAVTVLTYDNSTGRIVDADLLVNGGGRFFKRFESDESSPDDNAVSIESGAGSDNGSGTASLFDLQSVVTHELGHFFGLGEDYDDTKATMYIATKPGEIHKRVLTASDSDIVTALYASPADPSQSVQGGCGRSQLAPKNPAPSSWIGFAAAALGLGLMAAARRSRAAELRVRALAPLRRSGVRRAVRFGGWLTAVGLGLFLLPPDLQAAAETDLAARGDADVEVVATHAHWVNGIVETDLTYRVTACHVARCLEGDQHTVVSGGTLGGVTQVVGPYAAPAQGAKLHIALSDQRSFYQRLTPTFKP
jgi:hypothetical protein